jgi:hypothetical protein
MTFTWGVDPPLDDARRVEIGLGERFESREAAEAWLSSVWPELADVGVVTVMLVADGQPVYTMALDE